MSYPPTDRARDCLVAAVALSATLCAAAVVLLLVAIWRPIPVPLLVLAADVPVIAVMVTVYLAGRRPPAPPIDPGYPRQPVGRRDKMANVGRYDPAELARVAAESFVVGMRAKQTARRPPEVAVQSSLERSMYWQVYCDVINDLSGFTGDGDPLMDGGDGPGRRDGEE